MNDDFDLSRLADIGDPFASDASAPPRPMDAPSLPPSVAHSPTRQRASRARAIALGAAVVFDAAYVVLRERRPDLGSLSPAEIGLGLGVPLAAAALATGAATRSGARGLGLSATRIAGLVVLAPCLFALGTLMTSPATPDDPLFWKHAAICASVTAVLALGPLALALWAFRHAFAAAAGWRTAALGVAAGALGAATMSLACPNSAASHIIVGHGVMMLLGGLAGALIAPAVARS